MIRHSENTLTRLIKSAEISIQESENLIDSLLGKNNENDEDDDIVIIQESVKLSLKCPVTMKRMKLPVRGRRCRHVDVSQDRVYIVVIHYDQFLTHHFILFSVLTLLRTC